MQEHVVPQLHAKHSDQQPPVVAVASSVLLQDVGDKSRVEIPLLPQTLFGEEILGKIRQVFAQPLP